MAGLMSDTMSFKCEYCEDVGELRLNETGCNVSILPTSFNQRTQREIYI